MIEHFELGDTVRLKKKHPCGSDTWLVIRTGADVKLKCLGCARVVMLDRCEFMKRAVCVVCPRPQEKNEVER